MPLANDVPKYVGIQEHKGLIRDTTSMAVINVDDRARENHRLRREKILNDKRTLQQTQQEVSSLKGEINELRNLLNRFLLRESEMKGN